MKRFLTVIMALAMILSLFAFPATSEAERPTLTIFLEGVATVEDFETNDATIWLQDKLNVELDFIVAPAGSAEEKMNILLNSGNYPDIFYLKIPDQDLYGVETGILMDLTPFIPDMEYFGYALDYYPELRQIMLASDGKLYAFPTYGGTAKHMQYSVKWFINSANLEKLGMEAPTDTDELYEVLKAWKELDPEKNIPLTGSADNIQGNPVFFLTNAFTYQPMFDYGFKLGLRLHYDTVETMYDDEEYRDALRYMHKLYEEGLLYEGSFTQSQEQGTALLASEGEPVLIWAASHNVRLVVAANSPELYAHTDFLTPLTGPDGKQYVSFQPQGSGYFFAISKTCEYPELAVQLADEFYNAFSQAVMQFGPIELGNWRYPTEEEIATCVEAGYTPISYIRTTAFESGLQNFKWQPATPSTPQMQKAGVPHAGSFPQDLSLLDFDDPKNGANYRQYATETQYEPYYQDEYRTIPGMKFTPEEKEEKATIEVSLESYISQARTDFITGKKDLEDDWDAYVAGIQDLQMDRLVEIYQQVYDRNNQ
ncbi:MAG: extracellular solute-binding protein [Clostridia bacterium]|nr:extracellular solute-binding protein [Clostridia bacterium]